MVVKCNWDLICNASHPPLIHPKGFLIGLISGLKLPAGKAGFVSLEIVVDCYSTSTKSSFTELNSALYFLKVAWCLRSAL